MPVTSPSTVLRQKLIGVINAEFAPENITAASDRLDESLGWDGTYVAVHPDIEEAYERDSQVQLARVIVQFYGRWDKRVDPKQQVDPTAIETLAERFKRACHAASSYVGSQHDWFFQVERIEYPNDPTGNKTRFVAAVTGWAQNPSLVETTG